MHKVVRFSQGTGELLTKDKHKNSKIVIHVGGNSKSVLVALNQYQSLIGHQSSQQPVPTMLLKDSPVLLSSKVAAFN